MKSVLISIRPKWCELIASGKKTIEIRKTKPNLQTPFKCYIYMTKGNASCPVKINGEPYICHHNGGGIVIGEFVCDEIESFTTDYRMNVEQTNRIAKQSCLDMVELMEYEGNSPCLFGWHISDLVNYDKPKELREFERWSEYGERHCGNCEYSYFDYSENCKACSIDYDGTDCPKMKLTRPPQSWCYVQERDT